MQVFPPSVADRGWSPVRETSRLWKHVAPSRQRWLLTGCHHPTGPQRVDSCAAQWPSSPTNTTPISKQHHPFVSPQVCVQTLSRDPEGPRWLHHWCRKSCRCIDRYWIVKIAVTFFTINLSFNFAWAAQFSICCLSDSLRRPSRGYRRSGWEDSGNSSAFPPRGTIWRKY